MIRGGWQAVAVVPEDYAWVFDLVAADERVRHRALSRHQALLAAATVALHRENAVLFSTKPHQVAKPDQARADMRWHRDQTIEGPLEAFFDAAPDDADETARWASFMVLSLRWEASFPEEWRARDSWMWSPWSVKERLLHRLGRHGIPAVARAQMVDLLVSALERPYRCKDWMFAGLAHHLGADPYFRGRVQTLAAGDDAVTRLRARFVLHVARHREMVITRTSWSRWLESSTAPGSYAG